ncbi:hypothetical protein TNCV_2772391 [Trichonephila clavipes]|nr:hypothetical protein TNCV_2772391 [Trichonephila clavipes]
MRGIISAGFTLSANKKRIASLLSSLMQIDNGVVMLNGSAIPPMTTREDERHVSSINLKYEAISIPQGSVHLFKKTQERKSSSLDLLITKGVTSSSPVPLKIRRVGELHVKSIKSSIVLLKEWCGSKKRPAHVSFSSLNHDSKSRGPSPKALV